MRRLTLVSFSILAVSGVLTGCGDNKPGSPIDGAVDGTGVDGSVGDGSGGPMCVITKPTVTATHPSLNGVPVANGGDRVSSPGGTYEVEFDVTTNIEDGQTVELRITNTATASVSTVVDVAAMTGKAVFAGVTLSPDGTYDVQATCTSKAGHAGLSTKEVFPVDSTPPDLTISSPADGTFFGPSQLTGGAFKVCAQTKATDAVNLPATLGAAAVKNLSVAVGTASPDPTSGFVAVTAVSTDTCISVTCTSSSPIDLTVTLKDAAGNPTTKTISQISCATSLPGVQIISPTGDTAPFSDPTKHLLAANSTNTLKDQDATKTGGQWTVVACSDKAGMATLLGGAMGGTLVAIGTPIATVAAVAADGCPAGHTQVAKFTNATIPDSMLNADGTLKVVTVLEVDVTDTSTAVGKSPEVDLWVASVAPSVANYNSSPICNTVIQSTVAATKDVTLISSTPTVTLTVTGPSGATMYGPPTAQAGFVTFSSVSFQLGTSTVTAIASDKAGNSATLAQPCTVQVGTPPVVTFTSPTATQSLCAVGNTSGACVIDADGATAGWQGPLTVSVSVQGAPATSGTVTFTASSASAPLGTANISASGVATLSAVTIPDGNAVTITATTSAIGTNGVGTTTRTIVVDTIVPSAPAALTAVVKDRRQTSFTLNWTAPADGAGATVAGYDIRYSQAAITPANFSAATVIPSGGSPQAPGAAESLDVTNLYIENDYYFAVAATDSAGNVSSIVSAGPVRASFKQTFILGPQTANLAGLGYYVDGSGNFVGDANSDILAGEDSGTHAYIFAGSANFTAPAPAVTFQGSAMYFGGSIANIGDIDGDGLEDIAVSSAYQPQPQIFIFKGRATWPAMLMDTQADYTITADTTFDGGSLLGYPMVKLGDINGDGIGDFAVGASQYNTAQGALLVVLGAKPFGDGTLSTLMASKRAIVLTLPGAADNSFFGESATVLGAKNGTLVVGAFGAAGNAGELLAYQWAGSALSQVGTTFMGPNVNDQIGGILSPLGGGAGVISNSGVSAGAVDVFFDGSAADPLAGGAVTFTDSASPTLFGVLAIGGGFSGSNLSVSFIGDSHPDLVLGAVSEGGQPTSIYIVDGGQAASLSSPADVVSAAKVKVALPSDWRRPAVNNSPVKDINGDGYGDIAIGETDNGSFAAPFQGRVLVLW